MHMTLSHESSMVIYTCLSSTVCVYVRVYVCPFLSFVTWDSKWPRTFLSGYGARLSVVLLLEIPCVEIDSLSVLLLLLSERICYFNEPKSFSSGILLLCRVILHWNLITVSCLYTEVKNELGQWTLGEYWYSLVCMIFSI